MIVRYLGVVVFGLMAVVATLGVWFLLHKFLTIVGPEGSVLGIIATPILWVTFGGPCAFLALMFLLRFSKR